MAISLGAQLHAEVLDRVVRYVNGDMITQRELLQAMQGEMARRARSGQPIPQGRQAQMALLQVQLDELTKRALLLQEATRLGVVVDERTILRTTLGEDGTELITVQQRMNEIERRTEHQKIRAVIGFYLQHTPGVTPADLRAAYRERQAEFTRPDRRRLLRLAVRPTDEAEAVGLRRGLMGIFREASVSPDPAVALIIDDAARERVLAAPVGPERDAVLAEIAAAVAAAGTQEESARLVTAAAQLVEQHAAMRTPEHIRQELAGLRAEMLERDDPFDRQRLFRAAATRLMGADVEIDMGMVERGQLGEPYDEIAFDLPLYGLSEVFGAGQVLAVVFVTDVQAAETRGFAEVSAELRRQLEAERAATVETRVVADLRERAAIEDVRVADLRPEDYAEIQADLAAQDAAERQSEE